MTRRRQRQVEIAAHARERVALLGAGLRTLEEHRTVRLRLETESGAGTLVDIGGRSTTATGFFNGTGFSWMLFSTIFDAFDRWPSQVDVLGELRGENRLVSLRRRADQNGAMLEDSIQENSADGITRDSAG